MIRVIPLTNEYEKDVINLLFKFRDIFSDDYQKIDTAEKVVNKVQELKNNIFIALDDDEFIGLFYAYDFYTSDDGKKAYSCSINGASKRKVNPLKTLQSLDEYLKIVYSFYNIVKIKVKIERTNKAALKIVKKAGFKKEGFLKGESIKNGKLIDFIPFGKINPKYLRGTFYGKR